MCMVIYLASSVPLRTIEWREDEPAFNTRVYASMTPPSRLGPPATRTATGLLAIRDRTLLARRVCFIWTGNTVGLAVNDDADFPWLPSRPMRLSVRKRSV